MATCRRTATNENISTYGNATRDYTAFGTWEGARGDLDMVAASQSEILEGYDDEDSFDDYVVMSGATTNADYFPIIRPAAGQGHNGTPNRGFNIHNTASTHVIYTLGDHIQIQDLVIKSTIPDSSTSHRRVISISANHVTIAGCIVYDSNHEGASGNMYGLEVLSASDNIVVVDCLFSNIQSANGVGTGIYGRQTGSLHIYNTTLANCKTRGIRGVAGTTAKNCCSSGNGTDWYGTITKTTCTAEGASPIYKNAAGNDFHLASTDTVCRDNGTDLSGDATFPFDDDIDGELWGATWSIGFDQFSADADAGIWTTNPWVANPWTANPWTTNPWLNEVSGGGGEGGEKDITDKTGGAITDKTGGAITE